jgi:3-oxoacyl-[acyl-carrier protein] reductase
MNPSPTSHSPSGDDLLGLRGRRVLITGASRGIGRATARLFAAAGASVALTWRTGEAEALALEAELKALGAGGVALQADLSSEDEAARAWRDAEAALGGIDILVANHGVWPPLDVPLAEMTTAQWRRTLAVNLDGVFFLTREAARHITPGGRILLVSSTAAQRGEPFHGDYAASKGALISLVKGLALELAPRDVTVNAVAPGWVETDMVAGALEGEARTRALDGIPLGRIATPEDIAGPLVFLASALARHITAEVLNVNGGSVRVG